jgi:hypothetical protein
METRTSSASFTSIIYKVSLLLTATHAERVDVEISSFRIFWTTRDGRKETNRPFIAWACEELIVIATLQFLI